MPDFNELLTNAVQKHEAQLGTSVVDFEKKVGNFKKLFRSDYAGARPAFKELMTSSDFGILVQRVITDALQSPVEANYIGIELFSKILRLEPNTVFRFPIMGAVVASFVPNNQRIPRQDPAITQQVLTVDARRAAVAFDVEPELIDDSMYNLLSYFVEAGRAALLRLKEQTVWDTCLDAAHTMFDNENSDTTYWTSGLGPDAATVNGSFSINDMIDMMAGLVVNGYSPTDFIANPMAWAVWHKDPVMRAQFFTMGQIGAGIWSKTPSVEDAGMQGVAPFGVNYHVSRFMPVTFDGTLSAGVPAGTGTAAHLTDFLLVDRSQPIIIVEREGLTSDRWETQEIESVTLAMKEKYAVYGVNQGRAAVKAKNVRLVLNEQSIFNVGQVTL